MMKKWILTLSLCCFIPAIQADSLEQALCIGESGYLKGTAEEAAMARYKLTSMSGIQQCELVENYDESQGVPPTIAESNLLCFNATRNGFMDRDWADNYGRQNEICNNLSMAAKGIAFHGGEFGKTYLS